MSKKRFVWIPLCLFFLVASLHAQLNVLHSFAGPTTDGAFPYFGSLTLSGSTLYGMTFEGGTDNLGTIFKIKTNDTGFELLHSFSGGTSDGQYPYGSLILSGSTLYGMTFEGGTDSLGTIFKIKTNGTGFELLHSFSESATDGGQPYGTLILIGSTLYGMTRYGGTSNIGTIFKIKTNGTGFELVHSFAGGYTDGEQPYGSLVLDGTILYGMTNKGGLEGGGAVFKIKTNGTGFKLLYSFAGPTTDGAYPKSSLIISGSTLYGMTIEGGTSNAGTIFKIMTNGTGYELLHSFMGGTSDGGYPQGSLTLKGSTLYGMTYSSGTDNLGTIFKIKTNGTGFELLHSFSESATDGGQPYGTLILIGSTLYGMTYNGGASNYGVIFSYSLK